MHALLLIHTRSCGGAEKHVLSLAKELVGLNVKVTCAGPPMPGFEILKFSAAQTKFHE